MVGSRHHGLAAGAAARRLDDRRGVGGDDHAPGLGGTARRHTCTIIGSPPMSASGLPGRRVGLHPGGMTIRVLGWRMWMASRHG